MKRWDGEHDDLRKKGLPPQLLQLAMANNDETEKTYDEKMIIMTILLIMMTKVASKNMK